MAMWLRILRLRDASLRLPGDTSQSLEASKLWPVLSSHPSALIVDIGANDGITLSNSYFFVQKGWRAILVEPFGDSLAKAKTVHNGNPLVEFEGVAISDRTGESKLFLDKYGEANLFATITEEPTRLKRKFVNEASFITVETITLQEVLDKHNVPRDFALLSIDVEGHESKVLATLGSYRPSIILIERSLESCDESLKKQQILTSYEYIFAARIGCNEVYVDSKSKFIETNLDFFANLSSIGI
jgi:FkbM family methyltransferase